MSIEESLDKFDENFTKLVSAIELLLDNYETLNQRYSESLKNLLSAKSEINVLKLNIEQLSQTNEDIQLIFNNCKKILAKIDKIDELLNSIEIELRE